MQSYSNYGDGRCCWKLVVLLNPNRKHKLCLFLGDSVHKRPRPSLRYKKSIRNVTVAKMMLIPVLNDVPETFSSVVYTRSWNLILHNSTPGTKNNRTTRNLLVSLFPSCRMMLVILAYFLRPLNEFISIYKVLWFRWFQFCVLLFPKNPAWELTQMAPALGSFAYRV